MFNLALGRMGRVGNITGIQRAIAFLRSLGTSAHVWLPGANGTTVASLPSNNYLLSNGSTGYSTVDGVDGLTLDGMGSLGVERITNGDFSSGATGWTEGAWTISGGSAQCTNNSTSLVSNSSSVVGKTYKVEFTATIISGTLYVSVGANYAGSVSFTTSGRKTVFLVAGASANRTAEFYGGAVTCTIDDVSVKEYTGIHLTQPTTANKPLVRRGTYNLLTYSHTLTNTAWVVSTATRNSANVATASGADQFVFQGTAAASAAANPYTAAFVVSRLIGSGTISISSDSGFTYTAISVTSTPTLFVVASSAGTVLRGAALKFADSGDSVQIDGVGLFQGTWTAAQILAEGGIPTTTATAASNPTSGKYWWSFDGSNDSLLSGNLGITNACTIVIAGRVNSLTTVNVLFAEDTSGVALYIQADGSIRLDKRYMGTGVISSAGTIVVGVPFVITARLSAGTAVIRNLGVQVATAAAAFSFAATTGARVGSSFDLTSPLNGALGWVVSIAAALSDADCLTVEQLAAAQFPGLTTPDGDALALLLEDGSGFLTMETGDLILME